MLRTFAILFSVAFTFHIALGPKAQGQVVNSSYVCPDCGRVHSGTHHGTVVNQGVTSPVVYSQPVNQVSYSQPISSPVSYASNYSTTSYSPASPSTYSSGGTSNVLAMLNSQRARSGVPTLSYDSTLQAVAQRRAQTMASMGIKNHPPGSFAPGRYEGVGWSSSFSPTGVSACYTTDPNMRFAGAAMATGSDGVYFVVVYR